MNSLSERMTKSKVYTTPKSWIKEVYRLERTIEKQADEIEIRGQIIDNLAKEVEKEIESRNGWREAWKEAANRIEMLEDTLGLV